MKRYEHRGIVLEVYPDGSLRVFPPPAFTVAVAGAFACGEISHASLVLICDHWRQTFLDVLSSTLRSCPPATAA